MHLPAHSSKKRQYAAGETQVYYGSAEGQYPAESDHLHQQPYTQDSLQNIDLMTYPPDPRDLCMPPPEIRLPPGSFFQPTDSEPSGSFYQVSTLNAVPTTENLLHDVKIPLGLVITPYRTLTDGEVPIVDDGVIARCQMCKAYINPYVQFIDSGNRWRCSLCTASNDVPQMFDWNRAANQPSDRINRAELKHGVVDFVATPEYIRDPPQAPAYVFLVDIGQAAISSGMFTTAIRIISENLDNLPNDQLRTKVAVICYDVSLYFFSLPPGAETFDMLVVSDLEEAYLPRCHDLLVNLSETRQLLDTLLLGLPAIFADSRSSDSATGPALDSALALAAPSGGKIILLSGSVPTLGKGALDVTQPHAQNNQKEPDADKSTSMFYHALALSCIKSCVSIDMFIFGDRYRGVATLSLLPYHTAGQMFYYPSFNAADPEDTIKFATELGRVLAMPIMFEAEMRMRCSRGISVKSMHGNFFLQGPDRVVMPAVPMDQSYVFELQIDETIMERIVLFQTALLHTTSSGERRIRVLTLALPTTSVISEVFASADVIAISTLVAKRTVQRPSVMTLEDRREKLLQLVTDVCRAYTATNNKTHSSELQLRLPANLKLLPVLMLGLFKKLAIQVNTEMALDTRAYTRVLISAATTSQLIRYLYPNIYSLHNMPAEVGFIDPQGILVMPTPLPLTSAWWEPHGLYLIDDGQVIYLWVGRDAVPQLIVDVFGVVHYGALRGGKIAMPDMNTAISQRIQAIIGKIRERRGVIHYPNVCVVKDDASGNPALRAAVVQAFIHDRGDDLLLGYKQFLLKIYGK